MLLPSVDQLFTTPCCACSGNSTHRSANHAFDSYLILAGTNGHALLFSFQSMSIVYDFGNVFRSQSVRRRTSASIVSSTQKSFSSVKRITVPLCTSLYFTPFLFSSASCNTHLKKYYTSSGSIQHYPADFFFVGRHLPSVLLRVRSRCSQQYIARLRR